MNESVNCKDNSCFFKEIFKIKKDDIWQNIFKVIFIIWLCSIPFKNAIYQISTTLLPIFCIIHFVYHKNFYILMDNLKKIKIFSICVCFIILGMLISNFLNPELLGKKSYHLIFMFVFRYCFVFITLAYFYRLSFFSKKELLTFLFLGTFILSLTALFQIYQNPDVLFLSVENINSGLRGTLDNRNAMGLMMGVSVVFSLLILKKNFNVGAFLFVFFSVFMIFTFSRSNWVANGFAFSLFILLNFKYLNKKFFIFVLMIIISAVILYFNVDSFHQRFNQLIHGNSSYRTDLWSYAISQIKNHPIFGHGLDVWRSLEMPSNISKHTGVHNSTLEILLFTGFFGLLTWIISTIKVGFDIIKSKNYIYLCLLVYFVIVTQFDFSVFDSKELFSYITIFLFLVYRQKFESRHC